MKRTKIFIIINISIIIGSIIFINYLGNKINDKFLEYSEIEATRIVKYIVNEVAAKEVFNDIDMNKLLNTTKNTEDEIKSIEFNTIEVNKILSKITNSIHKMFVEFEKGNSNIIDLSNNLLTNSKIKDYKNGIIFEVPIGLASNNFILSNFGPKIPIKLSITGEIESSISTSVVEYGINNALITLYINIQVSEQILMPFKTKRITINQKIPVSISLINGKIPNYYLNGMNNNSTLYNLPIQ
jgi:sporulation protein YunB